MSGKTHISQYAKDMATVIVSNKKKRIKVVSCGQYAKKKGIQKPNEWDEQKTTDNSIKTVSQVSPNLELIAKELSTLTPTEQILILTMETTYAVTLNYKPPVV